MSEHPSMDNTTLTAITGGHIFAIFLFNQTSSCNERSTTLLYYRQVHRFIHKPRPARVLYTCVSCQLSHASAVVMETKLVSTNTKLPRGSANFWKFQKISLIDKNEWITRSCWIMGTRSSVGSRKIWNWRDTTALFNSSYRWCFKIGMFLIKNSYSLSLCSPGIFFIWTLYSFFFINRGNRRWSTCFWTNQKSQNLPYQLNTLMLGGQTRIWYHCLWITYKLYKEKKKREMKLWFDKTGERRLLHLGDRIIKRIFYSGLFDKWKSRPDIRLDRCGFAQSSRYPKDLWSPGRV